MNNHDFKSVALNWKWLKLLIPFWIIFGGIPVLLMGKQDLKTSLCIFAVAAIPALAATIFCIRCFIYYLKDIERQKQELEALENELDQLQNEKRSNSKQTEEKLEHNRIKH